MKRKTLADQLRTAIRAKGLPVNALARNAGIPQPVLQRFLTGTRADIKLSTADRLCAYLGLELRRK